MRAGLGAAVTGVVLAAAAAGLSLAYDDRKLQIVAVAIGGAAAVAGVEGVRRSPGLAPSQARLFRSSIAVATTLYLGGPLWITMTSARPSWLVFGPYCAVVAAPMLAAGHVIFWGSVRRKIESV
jgi:hypothetical protein